MHLPPQSRLRALLVVLLASVLAAAAQTPVQQQPSPERVVFVVPVHTGESDRSLVFLPVVPAACVANGKPIVLAVDPAAPWRPELLDFLRRYQPTRIWTLGELPSPPTPVPGEIVAIEAASLESVACELAQRFFAASKSAVLCSFDDRAAALNAAVLAGRLQVPLLPCGRDGPAECVQTHLAALGVEQVFAVGADQPTQLAGMRVERLAEAEDVARCLERNGRRVAYLAAVNPDDHRATHAANLSLAAVLLAVGRDGVIAPTPTDVQWKREFAAAEASSEAPSGALPTRSGWRRGTLGDGKAARAFVTGADPKGGHAFAQFDHNGDGDFRDPGEDALRTGDEIALDGRTYAVDLDVDEHARGRAVWLTSPTAGEIARSVRRVRSATRGPAETLCLVGWPDTLPMAVVGDGGGIDADLVSDVALVQTDDDPFVDLDHARFVAEDVASGTLLACRGLVLPDLKDRAFAHRFATAEWAGNCEPMLSSLGLEFAGHHGGDAMIDQQSPLTEVGLIRHGSHAMWTVMGKTCGSDSTVLLAPCLVESSGCSTAALDMDPTYRSVAARMLRNGALAFAGNKRRGAAQQELFSSEFMNAMLAGRTLGQANRAALNRVIVAMLDRGELTSGMYRYQLHAATVLGDPALVLDLLPPGERRAAGIVVRGLRARVTAPEQWSRIEYAPAAEWGCAAERLHTWRGFGMGTESAWFGPEKRNQDELVFTAEVRTKRRIAGVMALDDGEGPLHFDGKAFIDEHDDGSRSVFWRVRLLAFDMIKGEIVAQRPHALFQLRAR